jgi:predicted TIM-barrel fold metal-dependent hydrolase
MSREQFVAALDRCGVDAACVFTLMGFFEDSRRHNDLVAERASALPKRLIPFITVDPKLGDASVEELKRCAKLGVFRGIKFHPWLQAFAPSMVKKTLVQIAEIAAENELPILFHDGTPPYATTFQIAAVARWVPAAKIVLGHAGLADYTLPAAQLARDIPNLFACVCGPRPADIAHIVATAEAEKVLFGSDLGLSDWMILADRLDAVRYAGLSDEQTQMVLGGNARRLLHLS